MDKDSSEDGTIRSRNLPPLPGKKVQLPSLMDDPVEAERWNQAMADPGQPKVLDLFCGAGGMSAGFLAAGFVVATAIDFDRDSIETFAANIPARVICRDVSEYKDPTELLDEAGIDPPDVIIGGPPCQGFSLAGRSRIRSLDNETQVQLFARNELYEEFFRFIEAFRPSFFLMENVPGLLSYADGAYIKAIEQESNRLQYDVAREVLDAVSYGVPQFRKRLFVVGRRKDRPDEWLRRHPIEWPAARPKSEWITLASAIGDLPFSTPPCLKEKRSYDLPDAPTIYQRLMRQRVSGEDQGFIYDHVVRPVRDDDQVVFAMMKPGDKYTDVPVEYRRYDDSKFKDKYYKLKPDAPGNTITAHMAKDGYRYIHWDSKQHRTLSPREAARIQSFGDHFRFTGSRTSRYRMIGNAVPPLLAKALAEQIREAWRDSSAGEWQLGQEKK